METLKNHGAGVVDDAAPAGVLAGCEVSRLLDRWFPPADGATEQPVSTILYWAGHGAASVDQLHLMTTDSPTAGFEFRSARIDLLAAALHRHSGPTGVQGEGGWTLVILDCCQGSTGMNNLMHHFTAPGNTNAGLGFLASGADAGASFSGSLVKMITTVLGRLSLSDTSGMSLDELLAGVRREAPGVVAADAFRLPVAPVFTNPRSVGGAVATTMSALPVLERVLLTFPIEVRTHFLAKAQGTEFDDRTWFFEGREQPTRDLNAWLANAVNGMYVVTGRAGVGKSAFLGRIVTLAEPALLNALLVEGVIDELPAADQIPQCALDGVIHLTAKTFADAVARVAELVTESEGAPPTDIEAVLGAFARSGRRWTVLVDALDEALDPLSIAASLLRRLASLPEVRMVIGTRRSLLEGPDMPDPTDHGLLDALAIRPDDPAVHVLDDERDAIECYVTARLSRGRRAYPAGDPRTALAADLARDSGQPFLFARLATVELLARPLISEDGIQRLLGGTHRDIFAAALERLSALEEPVIPLLRALAYGLGRGFPRRSGIWVGVANALEPARQSITESHADATLAQTADYVVHDGEAGQATYRLAHRTFAEHFLADTTAVVEGHARVTETLVGIGEADGWESPNPYIVMHSASHARLGDAWDELLDHDPLLDYHDQERLAVEAQASFFNTQRRDERLLGLLWVRSELAKADIEDRTGLRSLGGAHIGGTRSEQPRMGRWRVNWAGTRARTPNISLTGHKRGVASQVTAVAFTTLVAGKPGVRSSAPLNGILESNGMLASKLTVALWTAAVAVAVAVLFAARSAGRLCARTIASPTSITS